MGCCSSRPAAEEGDASQPQTTSHAAPITLTAPARRTTSHQSPTSSPTRHTNRNASAISTSSSRPNKPLRPPSPVPRCPPERALSPWTPSQLARERDAFFDTRVTGDPSVWTVLRAVCEALRAGETADAQAMMDAVGLTCPTGRIKSEKPKGGRHEGERRKGAVFDESGRGYEIPGWIVCDPLDLAPEPEVEEKFGDGESDFDESGDEEALVEGEEISRRRRRDEKGKSKAEDIGVLVKVRARLSDKGSDVIVEVGEKQKVKVLIKKIQDLCGEKSSGKRVRLFHLGKELSEDRTLADQGWQEGHIVSAMVLGGS